MTEEKEGELDKDLFDPGLPGPEPSTIANWIKKPC